MEETLVRVYQPGEPCVFALLDDIAEAVAQEGGESDGTVGTEGELVEFNPSGLLIAATVGSTAVGRSLKEQEGRGQEMYHALVRTHHITSRKKVAKLKQAADALGVYVLLRSGGSPGLMYVEGREEGVKEWVSVVQVGGRSQHYQRVTKRSLRRKLTMSYRDSGIRITSSPLGRQELRGAITRGRIQ